MAETNAETAALIAWMETVSKVLGEVSDERVRQQIKWGEQNHPDGTGPEESLLEDVGVLFADTTNADLADAARDRTNALAPHPGRLTYAHIFLEEVGEALAEDDPAKLRTELIQVAAVAAAWVEKIDRDLTTSPAPSTPEEGQ